MEHLPQSLGTPLVEGGVDALGTRRFGHQSIYAALVEVVDGVAHRLLSAAQVGGYLWGLISPRTRQQDLGAAQSESVFGAQSGFKPIALLFRKRTYKDWRFHGYSCSSLAEVCPGDALAAAYGPEAKTGSSLIVTRTGGITKGNR